MTDARYFLPAAVAEIIGGANITPITNPRKNSQKPGPGDAMGAATSFGVDGLLLIFTSCDIIPFW
jgi:hypothetical protein